MKGIPGEHIQLKHGAGGPSMRRLIESLALTDLAPLPEGSIGLEAMDDGAAIKLGDRYLVVSTDSHVVKPVFFPGGDLGRLAITGTVNDLAMMGATHILGLTCAVVVEEGFPLADIEKLVTSMREACLQAGAPIITGDTKVMGKGELDGIVVNTTGLGLADRVIRDCGLQAGDVLLVTGSLGNHGMAVMASRHALELEGDLRSDAAPLNKLVETMLAAAGNGIAAMKDPTRGGLTSALFEMAEKSRVGIELWEKDLPIRPEVRAAADLLGIDPLQVANEGIAVLGVRPAVAQRVLDVLRAHPLGRDASIIGRCTQERPGQLILDTGLGRRLLIESDGEPMPRIC